MSETLGNTNLKSFLHLFQMDIYSSINIIIFQSILKINH